MEGSKLCVMLEFTDIFLLLVLICSLVHSVAALIRSREMQALVGSSRDLVTSVVISTGKIAFTAGGLVVDVALLPVTIPCHVASTATGLVAGVAGSVMHKVIGEGGGGQPSGEERRHSESPIDTFIHNIFNVIPFVANTAAQLVAPVLGIENEKQQENETSMGNHWSSPGKEYTTSSGESSAERQHVLDRLKLDFELSTVRKDSLDTAFTRATPSDISKYLLRVDDIIVMVSPDPTSRQSRPRRALFVDIGSEFADDSTTEDALAQLIQRGLDISATNVSAHMAISDYHNSSSIPISWKPEGHTARIARKLVLLDQEECYRKLHNHVLVWSGKYSGPKYYGSENPLFLARGVVRRSPRDFFEMLWDSDRTGEYNHFSLGRSDTLVIDDSISSTGTSGAKVIKSDTKVPFAGITVTLSALMHGKKLNEGTEEGYVIVSRSLCSGMAGCHVGSSKRVEKNNKNEILLGVNIMRPVPGHPELTDLMSVSQVSSSMVPQFLALRIGMMGVDDFFSNVRK